MLEKITENVRFYSPLKDFKEDEQNIEYRKDPLTGKWSRVNIQRSKRVMQGQGEYDYEALVERSRQNCFFCPQNIEKSTPKFDSKLISKGYIKKGETRVFPNLFPFARHHAVATLTEQHFLRTGGFEKKHVEDTLLASIDFCKQVQSSDKNSGFVTFNWNHLFPSGASIIHPHVQITLDSRPTYMTERILEESKKYRENKGKNFWKALIEEEKRLNERYIKSTDGISFLASYSPFGNNEVLIIFERESSFTELEDRAVGNLSEGIIRILKGYEEMGVESFNLTTYSGPSDRKSENFNLNMRFISRAPPKPYYTSDVGFMEGLHFERVVESLPEDVASIMRGHF
jgi:galactose-1-phosphate uridylyltransferase